MITLALAAAITVNGGQAIPPAPKDVPSNSMEICGKKVTLGQLPSAALKGFYDGSDCIVHNTKDDQDLAAIMKGSVVYGTVKFTHGVVSEITREWAVDIKSTDDFARTVVNALQEVKANSAEQCFLSDINQTSPSSETRGSVLTCGKRTLVFATFNEAGQHQFQIEEILSN